MSIANLFSPNDYDLYCNTLTTNGSSPILSNVIDTINNGDTLQIAPVKAGAVQISHAGALVTLNETTSAPRLNAPIVGTATPVSMGVGSGSVGLVISSNGVVILDRAAPVTPADGLFLGNTNAGAVTVGRVGGTLVANTGLTLSAAASLGGGTISYFENMVTINATCSGCIPATANFIRFEAFRLNNVVMLRYRPTSVDVVATAATTLSVGSALPANFLPIGNCRFSVGVVGLGSNVYPGVLSINTAGAMSFAFMPAPHGAAVQNWAIGEPCNITNGNVSFAVI